MCLVELKPPRCASGLFGEVQQFPDKGKHMFQPPEAPPRMVNVTVVGTYPQIISAVSTFMKYDLEKKRTSIINIYSLNIVCLAFPFRQSSNKKRWVCTTCSFKSPQNFLKSPNSLVESFIFLESAADMILPVDNFYNKRLFLWALRSLDQEIGKRTLWVGEGFKTHRRIFVFYLKTMGFIGVWNLFQNLALCFFVVCSLVKWIGQLDRI